VVEVVVGAGGGLGEELSFELEGLGALDEGFELGEGLDEVETKVSVCAHDPAARANFWPTIEVTVVVQGKRSIVEVRVVFTVVVVVVGSSALATNNASSKDVSGYSSGICKTQVD
jgi:hypothetical protein